MITACAQMGATCTYQYARGDLNQQNQLIDNAVAQGVDGIASSDPNANALMTSLKAAEAKGIPVVTFNSGASDWRKVGAIAHVGSDEIIAGETAGGLFNGMGLKHILAINQEPGNSGLAERIAGAKKSFKGTVTELATPGFGDMPGASAAMKAALLADPTVDGIFTLSEQMAPPALAAIRDAGSKAIVGSTDISPGVLDLVKNGQIKFLLSQQSYLQGYLPAVILGTYLNTGNIIGAENGPVLTGPAIVTKDNIDSVSKYVLAGKY
jgi:simple sugar transport system substrate-binding protein